MNIQISLYLFKLVLQSQNQNIGQIINNIIIVWYRILGYPKSYYLYRNGGKGKSLERKLIPP